MKDNNEKTADQKYKEWREKYVKKDFRDNNEPLVSIKDIKTYLFKKRLARLILIVVGMKKKCFLNDIYETVNKIFEVRSYTEDYLRCANKLSLYNLISIHRLSKNPDNELIERYKSLKTKCSMKRIHYYEFNNNSNQKNIDILQWCSDIEFNKK